MSDPSMDLFYCRDYGRLMTPQGCVANRESLFCFPGWPCKTCEAAVEVAPTPKTENQKPETGFSAAEPHRRNEREIMTEIMTEPGVERLPKTGNRKPETVPRPRRHWPEHLKNATAAVRRAWLEEG